jgi:hypothetical protein
LTPTTLNILITARLGSVSSSAAVPHFSTEKELLGAQSPWVPFRLSHQPSLLQTQHTRGRARSGWQNMLDVLTWPTGPMSEITRPPHERHKGCNVVDEPDCVRSTNQSGHFYEGYFLCACGGSPCGGSLAVVHHAVVHHAVVHHAVVHHAVVHHVVVHHGGQFQSVGMRLLDTYQVSVGMRLLERPSSKWYFIMKHRAEQFYQLTSFDIIVPGSSQSTLPMPWLGIHGLLFSGAKETSECRRGAAILCICAKC